MRRVLWAVLFTAASIGIFAVPAGAETVVPTGLNPIVLSYDFSDNSQPPAVSNGAFNITVDVLPEHTAGVVRVVAFAPDGSGNVPVVCDYQQVQQSQIECPFIFTTNGLWSIKADFAAGPKQPAQVIAVTVLRVGS
jgi:hypothetical protein